MLEPPVVVSMAGQIRYSLATNFAAEHYRGVKIVVLGSYM